METETISSKTWDVTATVEKWDAEADHLAGLPADDVLAVKDNLLLNDGINLLLDLLIGAGGTPYNNGNSYIGVGDSTNSAAATQDSLEASSNKNFQGMESGFPQVSGQTVTWKAVWASGNGNFAWNEWTISNSNSDSGTNLNRKVASLGTKAAGSSWTLTVTITVS
tara:strand:- start:238 stop:735 length:498 start_codon:yes stop_codon:yes gene_type:complete